MGSYRLIEHTADMGIEATADTPENLFAEAAYGLTEMVVGEQPEIRRVTEKRIEVDGGDRGELLVNFLNEVLFLIESESFLPADIEVEEASESVARASLRGDTYEKGRHEVLEREVKSVTYHQLKVEKGEQGWEARVFVDL
jgi:SHS2 domain-containing protein